MIRSNWTWEDYVKRTPKVGDSVIRRYVQERNEDDLIIDVVGKMGHEVLDQIKIVNDQLSKYNKRIKKLEKRIIKTQKTSAEIDVLSTLIYETEESLIALKKDLKYFGAFCAKYFVYRSTVYGYNGILIEYSSSQEYSKHKNEIIKLFEKKYEKEIEEFKKQEQTEKEQLERKAKEIERILG